MRYFWWLYYHFRKPRTKGEVLIAIARMKGLRYINIHIISQEPSELRGLPNPSFKD
jgi:hypothetical protein